MTGEGVNNTGKRAYATHLNRTLESKQQHEDKLMSTSNAKPLSLQDDHGT